MYFLWFIFTVQLLSHAIIEQCLFSIMQCPNIFCHTISIHLQCRVAQLQLIVCVLCMQQIMPLTRLLVSNLLRDMFFLLMICRPIHTTDVRLLSVLYIYLQYTPCPHKKGATKLMAVTSSNLNRFSKFFTTGNFQQNTCVFSYHTLSMLLHYLWEFKNSNLLQNKVKTPIIFVKK